MNKRREFFKTIAASALAIVPLRTRDQPVADTTWECKQPWVCDLICENQRIPTYVDIRESKLPRFLDCLRSVTGTSDRKNVEARDLKKAVHLWWAPVERRRAQLGRPERPVDDWIDGMFHYLVTDDDKRVPLPKWIKSYSSLLPLDPPRRTIGKP